MGEQRSSAVPQVRFKAVYLDMDGTLLAVDKSGGTTTRRILPETSASLDTYKKCGGHYSLATGRTLEQVKPYLSQLRGLPNLPLILYNGGLVLSTTDFANFKVVYKKTLQREALDSIVASVPQIEGVNAVFAHYVQSTIINRDDENVRKYRTSAGINDVTLCEGESFAECVGAKAEQKELPIKVMLNTAWGAAESVSKRVKEVLGDSVVVLVGSPETIEILPRGVDKSIAIREVMKRKRLSNDDIAVFGDSGNDKGMLDEFSASFAMGNCSPQAVCEAASTVIGRDKTPAIANIINRLFVLDACKSKLPRKKVE